MSNDPGVNEYVKWRYGVAVIIFLAIAAGVGAKVVESLGVPYGSIIGGVVGIVMAFLGISYWFYGR